MTLQEVLDGIRRLLKDPGSGVNAYHSNEFIYQIFNNIQNRFATGLPPATMPTLQANALFVYANQVITNWANVAIGEITNLPSDLAQLYDVVYFHYNGATNSGYDEQPCDYNPVLSPFQYATYIQPTRFVSIVWYGRYAFQNTTPATNQLIIIPALESNDLLKIEYIRFPLQMNNGTLTQDCELPAQLIEPAQNFTCALILLSSMSPDIAGGQRFLQLANGSLREYMQALGYDWEAWKKWADSLTSLSVPGR